jgi:hypothetical protein
VKPTPLLVLNCGLCGFQLKLVHYELAKGGSDVREESQRPSNSENDAAPVPDSDRQGKRSDLLRSLGFHLYRLHHLRSLTDFTGTFTKLGLTGLPLATIGLTIFFALLFMYSTEKDYMDLAKLTLGAFIGSFVQKQVGERQATGGVVELPSGEKLQVQRGALQTLA